MDAIVLSVLPRLPGRDPAEAVFQSTQMESRSRIGHRCVWLRALVVSGHFLVDARHVSAPHGNALVGTRTVVFVFDLSSAVENFNRCT